MFMDSKKSKTSETYRLLLNLTDKINLKRSDKYVALSNLSMHYTWKSMKTSCKNNKFKYQLRRENFELPDGSHSASDIQDHFDYIIRNLKH